MATVDDSVLCELARKLTIIEAEFDPVNISRSGDWVFEEDTHNALKEDPKKISKHFEEVAKERPDLETKYPEVFAEVKSLAKEHALANVPSGWRFTGSGVDPYADDIDVDEFGLVSSRSHDSRVRCHFATSWHYSSPIIDGGETVDTGEKNFAAMMRHLGRRLTLAEQEGVQEQLRALLEKAADMEYPAESDQAQSIAAKRLEMFSRGGRHRAEIVTYVEALCAYEFTYHEEARELLADIERVYPETARARANTIALTIPEHLIEPSSAVSYTITMPGNCSIDGMDVSGWQMYRVTGAVTQAIGGFVIAQVPANRKAILVDRDNDIRLETTPESVSRALKRNRSEDTFANRTIDTKSGRSAQDVELECLPRKTESARKAVRQ